jgi:enamine deaminase RidA (YjgF/YER057c/UK114 family)
MKISRHGIVERPNNLPHISGAVVHGDTVYLQGVTPDPGGDIASQTRQVLERIDTLLAMAGTDKSKLLAAQVWLSDMRLFEAHNAAWNAWVDRANPPVRIKGVNALPYRTSVLASWHVPSAASGIRRCVVSRHRARQCARGHRSR